MEKVSVLCVFLLLCSLSGAELQDDEVIEQSEVSPESVNVSEQPQPCPSDLHTVLRDMSAKLAKHEVRIKQLQTLNQEQAARLRDLEVQADPMKLQLQVHNTYLKSFRKTLNVTVNQVETLTRDKAVGQVAFTASLSEAGQGSVIIGPFNTDFPLIFRNIFSNIGNAYNPNTGDFIAPVRGAYHFEFFIGAGGSDDYASSVKLTKNGEHIVLAYEHQTNGYGSTGNGAILLLKPGDVVSLILAKNNVIYDKNWRCTFSGHLLFSM